MLDKTIREVGRALAPERTEIDEFLLWPPDVFALTSYLLWETDAYVHCVSPLDKCHWPPSERWRSDARAHAEKWIAALNEPDSRGIKVQGRAWRLQIDGMHVERDLPPEVLRHWSKAIARRLAQPLRKLRGDWGWIQALLSLHAMADEAGRGLGRDTALDSFRFLAFDRLRAHHSLALIDPDRGRVLPKFHTPQTGIALRSLSRHLAFDRAPIRVVWNDSLEALRDHDTVRCLVLPWPLAISTRHFRPWRTQQLAMDENAYGFFDFAPPTNSQAFGKYLRNALDRATEETGSVDVVVLPELALTNKDEEILRRECAKREVGAYVCGLRRPPTTDKLGENVAMTAWRSLRTDKTGYAFSEQHKHHRWCIDSAQVSQYQLGGVLHSGRSWWEAIQVRERSLMITKLGRDLSMCTLVCEDLARQDPMAGLLRSVGPSLVIALLMDGPQLLSRWPARYASVLADDPGSSVLTVTSLGMALRSQGPDGKTSRVIALWKDPTTGPREVALEPGSLGVVLSLCARERIERTADGRGGLTTDDDARFALVLSGVVQVPDA